ncbi:MAG: VPLPA-CTERM sorting domain-containing protein [Bryobacteraceae bacterium]
MNSRLARAHRFLTGRLKATALRVAPLALLAMGSMQAAVVLPDVNVTGPTFGFGSGSIFSTPIMGTNGTGLKFSGFASSDCDASACLLQFDFDVQNSGGPTALLDYAFTFQNFSSSPINWFFSNGDSTQYASGQGDGSGSVEVDNGTVRFFAVSSFGDGFSMDIPSNSIDFTPAAATNGVPEPASAVLMLVGAGAMLVIRRR